MKSNPTSPWPVLNRYDANHLHRLALPLGGIGTGTISLGGRGDLRDWEIVNRPAKGFTPPAEGRIGPFFALWVKPQGSPPVARLLEGPLPLEAYEGSSGARVFNHGLPRFRNCEFHAAYPLGQVVFSDPKLPVDARLEAFNPLVPCDANASGIPVVVLRYVLRNRTSQPVTAAVCGMVPNFIGADGEKPKGNRNEFRQGRGLHGLNLVSKDLDPAAPAWGTLALTVLGQRDAAVSYRTAWAEKGWGDSTLDFWEDFLADGRLDDRQQVKEGVPKATLATRFTIPARGTKSVTFLITWHFPNRQKWFPKRPAAAAPSCCGDTGCGTPGWTGNYYATQYRDAWDVAEKVAPQLANLEKRTVEFVRSFCDSDLPAVVKEAALNNVSTLRSQTTFRTADGFVFGWEGCNDRVGCCQGSCTHVWNYENALGFLFGDLSRGMRRVEFEHATLDNGLMCFRVGLPLANAHEWPKAAADGQMGVIMRFYRDWKLSGDETFLRSLWPKVRKALEFCWIPGGWDADQDGVMEGCQHNTMDVEYYGPNPQMGIWYLGALRAGAEMATHVGDVDFAATCRSLFERGRAWTDQNLFNGEYYEHQIWPAQGPVADGLRVGMGGSEAVPEYQLGAGCLVDQLVGQYMAHASGLGYLIDPGHAKTTLRSIMKYNFRESFHDHFNQLRSYVLGDEAALLMASYPRGNRPAVPFPYYTEVMTGFEYTAAVGMLYEGLTADGLKCIRAIRDRYDGRKRSPWDEAECGHHYARALASWTAVLALTGFQYSAVTGTIEFAAAKKPVTWFWSTGDAWGTCRQVPRRGKTEITLRVAHGALRLRSIRLVGGGETTIKERTLRAGQSVTLVAQPKVK